MKQFDEIFRQKTKDAFSDYDAGRLADAGWKAFLDKKKKRGFAGIIIPLWAKAASVAVLLTAGSLLTYRFLDTKPDSLSGGPVYETVKEDPSPLRQSTVNPSTSIISEPAEMPDTTGPKHTGIQKEIIAAQLFEAKRIDDKKSDYYAVIKPVTIPDSTGRVEEISVVTEASVDVEEIMVAESEKLQVPGQLIEDIENIIEDRTKKTFIMAGLSGMMARAEDISTGMPGLSFGIYGEHKISRRWAVRPGILLAMHTVGMENTSPDKNMNYSAPALNGVSGSIESFEGSLQLLAMEVPVNMVYTIIERGKKGLYVSAGASTLVYLNQNVSGNFRNEYIRESYDVITGYIVSETRYSSVSVENNEEPFSHTDFFGLANFSAGYSMPFGKSSRLLIEPYMQLPVNTLTSLNLRIRYGGISMKIRFGQNQQGTP
jgi:hypothetical protein